ncbi:MAG: laccase domain-containing protein [Desulfobulbaceae bacterium]|nr:laccase domain-containing protein [Desulfobulbaceae bacterium]
MLFSPAGEFPGYGHFPGLASDNLIHGVFGRRGGNSTSPYHSLNISFGVGDDPAVVMANRSLLKKALGIATLVSARQVHGDRILSIIAEPEVDFEAEGIDALITNCRTGVMIQQADCQAVIIHDPDTPALGVAHVGWRGSVAGIIGATVRAMTEAFGTDPVQLRAAISPALGACCAEFINYHRELPVWMHAFQIRPYHFDFPAISVQQLLLAGLRSERISQAGLCTRCNSEYFSYRRDRVTGRFATVAALVG